jgi:hypothetical protein
MRTDQEAFANRLKSLFNIDGCQLLELSHSQTESFLRDPARYFMRASDRQADAIFREIEKRQQPELDTMTELRRKFTQTYCSE